MFFAFQIGTTSDMVIDLVPPDMNSNSPDMHGISLDRGVDQGRYPECMCMGLGGVFRDVFEGFIIIGMSLFPVGKSWCFHNLATAPVPKAPNLLPRRAA